MKGFLSSKIAPGRRRRRTTTTTRWHLVELAAGEEGDPGHLQPHEEGKHGQLGSEKTKTKSNKERNKERKKQGGRGWLVGRRSHPYRYR